VQVPRNNSDPQLGLGDHTELRLLAPEDAMAVFTLIDSNRVFLRRWFDMVDIMRTPADSHAWIIAMLARREADPVRGWAGIFHREKLVGCVGVSESVPEKQTVEMGYYLAADACGHGGMPRICRTPLCR
jgi:ribosomal-protein-serine acetyltransferase